jgi:hypothetical protein
MLWFEVDKSDSILGIEGGFPGAFWFGTVPHCFFAFARVLFWIVLISCEPHLK